MTLRFLLLIALRDRLAAGMLLALAGIWLFATFSGDTSIAEQREAAAVFAAFAARLTVVLGVMLFVALQVRRLLEGQELHMILATPVSRPAFVVQSWCAFAALAAALALAAGAMVGLAGGAAVVPAGLALWTLTLMLEAAVLAAFALFVALGLGGALGGLLACAAFYVLGRMAGALLAIARAEFAPPGDFGLWTGYLVEALALVLPRLDLFADSRWLVHGIAAPETAALIAGQAVAYTVLLLAAAAFDFDRRTF